MKRAAPAKLLLDTLLDKQRPPRLDSSVYIISDAPPYEVIARAAIGLRTPIEQSHVILVKSSERVQLKPADYVFRRDDKRETLIVRKTPDKE